MDRNELIEKAKEKAQDEAIARCKILNEDMTPVIQAARIGFQAGYEHALSLEAKDEWPQKGDKYWYLQSTGYVWDVWSKDEYDENRVMRLIFRTEAEADLADRQRIARTAIHRWIEEKAEKVDDYRFAFSPQLFNGEWRMVELQYRIPEWFFVKTTQDYDRMMSENAQHFEVLKEGM